MSFNIRKARISDVERIEPLMRTSMAALGVGFYDPKQIASAVRFIAIIDLQLIEDVTYFLVETTEGDVVGCGGWSRRARLFTGEGAATDDSRLLDPASEPARVRAMFVHPGWSRRGIGRMILDACELEARREGFQKLELMATLPGVPLYAAAGYQIVERTEIRLPDGVSIGGAVMTKRVNEKSS